MSADEALNELSALCGIFPEYTDLDGVLRPVSPDTQRALLCADGLAADTDALARETLARLKAAQADAWADPDIVIADNLPVGLSVSGGRIWRVISEDGESLLAEGRVTEGHVHLPAIPDGVHSLVISDGAAEQKINLISTPAGTPGLADAGAGERIWGLVGALYGLHSGRNPGPGDFTDLAQLAEGVGAAGAAFLGINPVHALGWSDDQTISPYSPTHRGFLNTDHADARALDGVTAPDSARSDGMIDYAAHRAWQRPALVSAFHNFLSAGASEDQRAFENFCRQGGTSLHDFAMFEALSESFGSDWRAWPQHLRSPQTAAGHAGDTRVQFHKWLQWVADDQLGQAQSRARASGMPLGLYMDLAVGARRGGAEAWSGQDTVARGVSVGAPPDQLSPAGQNWQLAGYAPRALRAEAYAPLRRILARSMRHAGLLRIDHALGLNRSFWIPDDGSPGGYIRQPFRSLMAIIAIEARRAGTVIVGEDLGLVPPGFRDEIAGRGLYGYTVLQYEKTKHGRFRAPADLRPQTLACFGTHDTPTLCGFAEGCDIGWWRRLDWITDEDAETLRSKRQDEVAELNPGDDALTDSVHAALGGGAAAMVAVQLDDVIELKEAQNLPGTTDEHPNWRRRYPLAVPEIIADPRLHRAADIMVRAGRSAACNTERKDT